MHESRLLEPVEISAMEHLMKVFASIRSELKRNDIQSGV